MSSTKTTIAAKSAKGAAKHRTFLHIGAKAVPPAARVSFKLGKPVVKHRARRRVQRVGQTVGAIAETAAMIGFLLAKHGPEAAQRLGLVEPPKEKRTAPRVAAGALLGAGAVYFLEPGSGREHRERVLRLVS